MKLVLVKQTKKMEEPLEGLWPKVEIKTEKEPDDVEILASEQTSSLCMNIKQEHQEHVEPIKDCKRDQLIGLIPCCVVLDPSEVDRYYCAENQRFLVPEETQVTTNNQTWRGPAKSEPMDMGLNPSATAVKSENMCINSEQSLEVIDLDGNISDSSVSELNSSWSKDTTYFDNLNINWDTKKSQLKINFNTETIELEYFTTICDIKLMKRIVKSTNAYGNMNNKVWLNIDIHDLKALIGILIIMTIYPKNKLVEYWNSDPNIGIKKISDIMSYDVFKILLKTLHIKKKSKNIDKLHEIRPMLDTVNKNIVKIYKHSQKLSIDENFIRYNGTSPIQLYQSGNYQAHGYKSWLVTDSQTGYTIHIKICTGYNMNESSERRMLEICNIIETKPCIIAFDNYFTTISLMLKLLKLNIFAIGKVEPSRKELPEFMIKPLQPLQTNYDILYQTNGKLAAIKWINLYEHYLLTTCISPDHINIIENQLFDGSCFKIPCPEAISKYEELTKGQSHFNKMRWPSPVQNIVGNKWWLQIFYFLLDLSIVNVFILYELVNDIKGDRKENEIKFRLNLADQLLQDYIPYHNRHVIQKNMPLVKEIGYQKSKENQNKTNKKKMKKSNI